MFARPADEIEPDIDVPTQPLLRIERGLTLLKPGILKKLKGSKKK
jgi:hypothetical protein